MAQLRYEASGRKQTFGLGESFSLGREDSNDLPLPDDHAVSRRHARVRRIGDVIVVEDLGSRNGTFVEREGKRQRVGIPMQLRSGDVICVGAARLVLDVEEAPATSVPTEIVDAHLTDIPGPTVVGRGVPIPAGQSPEPEASESRRLPSGNLLLLIAASGLVAVLVVVLALVLARI